MVGLGLDAWMERIMKDAAPRRVSSRSANACRRAGQTRHAGRRRAHAGGPDDDDPSTKKVPLTRIAGSIRSAPQKMIDAIRDELTSVDPTHAPATGTAPRR